MDLFSEQFKIQDMIDSDMRCEFDNYLSVIPGSSPALPGLPPVLPMDVTGDSGMNSETSDDGMSGWMNSSSHIYNISSDFDSVGGLLVNPQTALPVSILPSSASRPLTPSSKTVNLTLTPQSNHLEESSTTSTGVTVPVHVITTTTTLVTDGDIKPSQVNLTVAVPTSDASPLKASKGTQVQHLLSFRKSLQEAEENIENPKSRSKQNKNSKLSKPISISNENAYPKPAYSYSCLIAMALKNSKTGSLPVNEIYDFMTENFPYFKTAPNGWKNSVRHNLSLNKCFEKIEKPTTNGAQRKGYLWALNPNKVEKMEEELQKWGSKDPEAIRKSMANPEKLELIEKGELNNSAEEDEEDEKFHSPAPNNRLVKKQFRIKEEPVDSSANADFSPLDAPVGIDPALPEFDLHKGIWENLCDDRLNFVNSSLTNSSSPKHASSNVTMDDDSLRTTSPSNLPKTSFIHANYIYSCSQSSSSELSSDEVSSHSMMEKTTVCDA